MKRSLVIALLFGYVKAVRSASVSPPPSNCILADLPETLRANFASDAYNKNELTKAQAALLPSIGAGWLEYKMVTDGVESLKIDGVDVVRSFYVTSRIANTGNEYTVDAREQQWDLQLLDGINGRFLTIEGNTVFDMERECGATVSNMAVLPHRNFAVEFKDQSNIINVHTDQGMFTISRDYGTDGSYVFRSEAMSQFNLRQLDAKRIVIQLPGGPHSRGGASMHVERPTVHLRVESQVGVAYAVYSEDTKALASILYDDFKSHVTGNQQLMDKIKTYKESLSEEHKELFSTQYVGDFALVTEKKGDKLVRHIVKLKLKNN